jgi:Fe-S cluster assembly protein SufD
MMSQAVEEKSAYRAAYQELSDDEKGNVPGWLKNLRGRAFERFESNGFPTTGEEDWKYTNVAPLARREFRLASSRGEMRLEADAVEPFLYEEARRSRLVFVNGVYKRELSSLESLPTGALALELSEAIEGEHAEAVREQLEQTGARAEDAFGALNTAFLHQGLFLRLAEGVQVETPIHLLFLSTEIGAEFATFPRVIVVAESGASATLIESYAALGDASYFTNAVVDITVGHGARVVHYKVQTESEHAFHVAATRAVLGRDSAYDLTTITLGAQLSRHNVEVRFEHEGAECWVDGLYLLGTGQHTDTHSLIDHRVPRCTSHQNYKGILDGKSRAVFNGRVYVRHDAQQTDAFQSNKNLLLSTEARVDTKPQLEIYADDVKCAHGATVGQLEEEELFYLISRGLNPRLARNLLTYGFAEEVVEKIKIGSIKRQLDEAILNRLHAEFAV